MNPEKWLIRGGWSVHGEIEIGGDTYSAIANICHAVIYSTNKSIRNVPRSIEVLSFIEFLNKCGFNIQWKALDKITCITNWDKFDNDLSTLNIENPKFFEIAIDIILFKCGSCKVPLKFRKHLDRYKRLKMQISIIEDIGYEVRPPLETSLQKIHIKSVERDFYTVLSYSLLKLSHNEIYITPYSYFDPIMVFQIADYRKKGEYSVLMSQSEFNFFASLAVLTEGEITMHNVVLSESLGYLLNLYNLGATYEVFGNSLRIWHDYKKIEQYYSYVKSTPDELGYLLLYLSTFSKNKVLVKAKNNPVVLAVIKNLNIMGCQLSYSDLGSESIMIEIRPTTLKSFRQQVASIQYGGVILVAAFIYEGNSIVSDIEHISNYFPFFNDNVDNLGLKFNIR